jgi:plastocyanin
MEGVMHRSPGLVHGLVAAAGGLLLAAGCAGAGTSPGWTALPPASVVSTAGSSDQPPIPTPDGTPPGPSAPASAAAPPQPSAAPSAETGALIVVARDLSFSPRDLSAASGGELTLTLQNDGRLAHNLTIDELDLKIIASPGKAKTLTVSLPAPGTYPVYCSVSGHRQAGMSGTLTLK